MTASTLVADLPQLLVQGSGTLALATEALDLHLRPMLRVGPGIVVPVRVVGTLSDPKPAVEPGEAGRKALFGALAGALTGHRPAAPATPCVPRK